MPTTSRRQREFARAKALRQAERRAAARRRRRRRTAAIAGTLVAVLVVVLVVSLALNGDGRTAAPAASPTPSATPRPVACGARQPPAPVRQRYPKEPPRSIDRSARYVMSMKTSCGTIEVELLAGKAPRTVNSFAFLASKRFFDGTEFSRSTDPKAGFAVLQGGDQEGTGAGGPGYTIPDENLEGARYVRGTVAMANTGRPNTGGSQFFLVADALQLPPSYPPFGRITKGSDVLDRILALGNDGSNPAGGGHPSQRVYIERLTVTKGR